jgi:D-3-phosphoglycerate dehydrogenase / 2-oxoglutarate reductase
MISGTVLLTDYAWPDLSIERRILEGAGLTVVNGPATALAADEIARLAARHRPAAIMTCWAEVSADAMRACPDLKIVQRIGVGLDNIDVDAAVAQGAVVTNVPDYCVEEVSDHAVGLVLAWARGIAAFGQETKRGRWDPSGAKLHRVRDLTIGIAGFGRIGRRSAEKLVPFGTPLLALEHAANLPDVTGRVRFVDWRSLLSDSDVVIIHLPLLPATAGIFNAKAFAAMRRGALLVNVARGGLVDNDALLAALDNGHLAGAALDVMDGEPSPPQAMLTHEKIIATPHIAFSSGASLAELRRRSAEEVVRVLSGEPPQNLCAPR